MCPSLLLGCRPPPNVTSPLANTASMLRPLVYTQLKGGHTYLPLEIHSCRKRSHVNEPPDGIRCCGVQSEHPSLKVYAFTRTDFLQRQDQAPPQRLSREAGNCFDEACMCTRPCMAAHPEFGEPINLRLLPCRDSSVKYRTSTAHPQIPQQRTRLGQSEPSNNTARIFAMFLNVKLGLRRPHAVFMASTSYLLAHR